MFERTRLGKGLFNLALKIQRMSNLLASLAVGALMAASTIPSPALAQDMASISDVELAQPVATPQAETKQAESPRAVFRRSDRFAYVIEKSKLQDSPTFVLLHGSGGNEKTLIDLARKISPDATLLGVRGRIEQDGINRWYRRLTPTSFDQTDIRGEASAFASFLTETAQQNSIDLKKAVFLGYSNGANLIGAVSLLHPGLMRKAVLLRAMPVLEAAPSVDLKAMDILTISGKSDATYFPYATALEKLLKSCGAEVEAQTIEAGHNIGDEDARLVRQWLTAELSPQQAAVPAN